MKHVILDYVIFQDDEATIEIPVFGCDGYVVYIRYKNLPKVVQEKFRSYQMAAACPVPACERPEDFCAYVHDFICFSDGIYKYGAKEIDKYLGRR